MVTTSDPGYAALLSAEKLKGAVRTVAKRVNRIDALRRDMKASRQRRDDSRITKLESQLAEMRAEQIEATLNDAATFECVKSETSRMAEEGLVLGPNTIPWRVIDIAARVCPNADKPRVFKFKSATDHGKGTMSRDGLFYNSQHEDCFFDTAALVWSRKNCPVSPKQFRKDCQITFLS